MGKSVPAKGIALFLRKYGEVSNSEEKAKADLEERMKAEDTPLPDRLLKLKNVGQETVNGCQVLVCGDASSEKCVLYVHGGAYIMEVTPFHIDFCVRLARKTGYCVYIPVYPLAPKHSHEETYGLMDALYAQVRDRTAAFMGDSAGGGFVFSYAQYLRDKGEKLPGQMIGLSPWVDISMSSPDYALYQSRDPMLGVPGLILAGRSWANGLDTRDPRLSPLYGDNRGLPPVTLFTGTDEIFYPDITLYAEKLKSDGVQTELVIGENMNHVYPLYPIPEARGAMEIIIKKLTL